jgi:hypothetical protein
MPLLAGPAWNAEFASAALVAGAFGGWLTAASLCYSYRAIEKLNKRSAKMPELAKLLQQFI